MAITGDLICYCGCHEREATTVLGKWHNRDVAAAAIVRQLVDALQVVRDRYVTLVESGDAGFWKPDVVQQDAALDVGRAWLEQEAR